MFVLSSRLALWCLVLFLLLRPRAFMTSTAPRKFSRNVKIDWDSLSNSPIVSWPEGITLRASSTATSFATPPSASATTVTPTTITTTTTTPNFASYTSSTTKSFVDDALGTDTAQRRTGAGWSLTGKPRVSIGATTVAEPATTRVKRIFTWTNNELLISCNMTALANPTCTRLIPQITWMSASGSRCKVLHDSKTDGDSIIEIAVTRALAEGSLSALRMNGFRREEIYRMLDKGPWILAFDIAKTIPKLMSDLEIDLSMNKTEVIHIISHCPFLIAQYARYRGRDVYSTVRALLDVGYDPASLAEDVMRFPSMLAAPPDRIRGWLALLQGFGVARGSGLFGKMLKRAPFMFHINPPYLMSIFSAEDEAVDASNIDDVSTTASAFVVYESLRVLQLLVDLNLPDLDKIVRTQPSILLCSAKEVSMRCNFLLNLFLDKQHQLPPHGPPSPQHRKASQDDVLGAPVEVEVETVQELGQDARQLSAIFTERMERSIDIASAESAIEARRRSHEQLGALLLSFPAILSIEYEQMRSAGNSLRAMGLRRSDVVQLARRHPPLLARPAQDLQNICTTLKIHLGLRKAELIPFLLKYPAILSSRVDDLLPKIEYLKQTLRGTPVMAKKFPVYFSFDLDTHIRPRAEFLRAVGLDPLINGLPFLVNAQPVDLSYTAGMQADVFAQFKVAFGDMWRRKKAKEVAGASSGGAVIEPSSTNSKTWSDALLKEDLGGDSAVDPGEDNLGIIGCVLDALDDEDAF